MEQKGIFDETDNEFSKTRQIEASFPKTKREKKISERFANYIIGGNYPDFLSKVVITNYHEPKK